MRKLALGELAHAFIVGTLVNIPNSFKLYLNIKNIWSLN
jgi:hypothetical protein